MALIMECRRFSLFLCILACLQIYVSASSCNVPSRFWCESEKLASACGVYEQCKNYEWSPRENAEQVDITLYYESLCPYSIAFITTMLYPTYKTLAAITNLTLIPYGNAMEQKVGDQWKFQCQHGPQECVGNIISTCTISIVKNITIYFPFLNCMEASKLLPIEAAQKCSSQFTVPLDEIFNCTTSEKGNLLEHEMASRTDALNPKHTYVPWVTLNGVHTEAIQQEALTNLKKLLCDAYKGTKPPACS